MANYFDQFDEPKGGNYFDQFDPPGTPLLTTKPKQKQNSGLLADTATDVKRGFEQLPGAATGLLDIPAGIAGFDRPVSRGAEWLGEKTGFQPGKWAESARSEYSPERQQAEENVHQAWEEGGFGNVAGALATNPRYVAGLVAESLPSTLAGGLIGRGAMGLAAGGAERLAAAKAAAAAGDSSALLRAGAIAGGVGEGAITAGQQMSQVDSSVDPQRAALTSLAAGAGTGVVGALGGRLATKMGLPDIDTAIASGSLGGATARKLPSRLAIGAAQEGLFEEMPQSMQEQIWQNVAEGKPWDEGVIRQGVEGALAGAVMGGGVNLMPRRAPQQQGRTEDQRDLLADLGVGETADMFGGAGIMGAMQTPGYNDAADVEARTSLVENLLRDKSSLEAASQDPQFADSQEEINKRLNGIDALLEQYAPANRNRRQMTLDFDNGTPHDVLYGNQNHAYEEALGAATENNRPRVMSGLFTQMPMTDSGIHSVRELSENRTMNMPLPTDIGSAVSVVQQLGFLASQVGGHIVSGSQEHAALLEAQKILKSNGLGYLAGFAPATSTFDGQQPAKGRSTQEVKQPAPQKAGTVESLKSGLDNKLATGDITPEQHAEATNAIDTTKGAYAKKKLAMEAVLADKTAGQMVLPATPEQSLQAKAASEQNVVPAVKAERAPALPKSKDLTAKQQPVYDHIVQAFMSGNQDEVIDASGKWQYEKISQALGLGHRGKAKSFIDGVAKRVAKAAGVDVAELKENLKRQAVETREEDASTYDKLGMSPAQQDVSVNEEDLFGSDSGSARTMGIIESAGGSQSDIGSNEQPHDYVDSVEPSENTKRHAEAERAKPKEEFSVSPYKDYAGNPIKQADIGDALELWEELDGTELPQQYHMQWTLAYIANADGVLNDKHFNQVYRRILDDIQNQPAETGGRATDRVSSGGERPQLESGATVEGSSRLDSERSDEEVSAESIEARWNNEHVTPWERLSDEQRDYILGSGTWEEYYEAATEVEGELNDVSETQFSKGEGGNSTVEALNGVVNELVGKSHPRIKIVQSVDELTPAEKAAAEKDAGQQLSQDEWGAVQAFVVGGKAYFIAGNIPAGAERAVFLHEIGAHMGIEKLLSNTQFKRLVGKIDEWAARNDNSVEAKIAKVALQRVAEAETNETQTDSEKVAYFIEEAVKAGIDPTAVKYSSEIGRWFRQLWAAFKGAIRRLTGEANFNKLSAQDVVDIAYGAAKLELTGTWHGTAADFRNFNHDYMGSGEGAQAFGWGTYLAQRVGIAKGYWKDDVRRKQVRSEKPLQWKNESPTKDVTVFRAIDNHGRDISVVGVGDSWSVVDANVGVLGNFSSEAEAKKYAEFAGYEQPDGSLMRVDVNVRDDELLDWDKPLSEQSQVRIALMPLRKFLAHTADELTGGANWNDMTGEETYRLVQRALQQDYFDPNLPKVDEALRQGKTDQAASEYLDSIGIKGIKFLDSQSRSTLPDVKFVGNDNLGRNRYVQDFISYMRRTHGDFTSAVQLMRDKFDVPVGSHKRDIVSTSVSNFLSFVKPSDFEVALPNQTRNLVIFNDKNIQRVATEVGADRERVKFSKRSIEEVTTKLPENLREPAFVTATNLVDWGKRAIYGTAFGHDFARMVEKILPSAKEFFDLKGKQGAKLTELESKVDDILEQAHKAKDIKELNSFLSDSTTSQKWGFEPEWKKGAVVDAQMAARFNKLSKEAQQAAKDIFHYGYENIAMLNKLVKDELTNGYDTAGLSPEEIKKLEKQKLRSLALFDKTFKAMQGPYAPLVRVGNYLTVAKSQEFMDAQARGDEDAIEKMQSDPDHYLVEFSESLGQAKLLSRKLEATKKYAYTDGYAKEHYYNSTNETPWAALKRIRSMIEADASTATGKAEKRAATAMRNMLNDLYFQSLSEGSARQFQNKRRKIAGWNEDMLRGFAIKGRADAHFLSNLMFSGKIGESITKMRSTAKDSDSRRALNEVLHRQAASLDYRQQPFLSKVQGLTSFHMLVTNPAYYIQNATQPFMMTLPWLAGKFGYMRSAGAFFKAYQDLAKGKLDIDQMPISKAEKAMLHDLKQQGILDIGINRELGYWSNSDNKGLNVMAKTQHFFAKKVQQLEIVNRVSSALAAYRLSGGKINEAADAIRATHGDYSQFNEPGFFSRVPAARLLLQFRKFQIIQLSMMARLMHNSFSGTGPEKAVARKSLLFLFGHIGVMAGAMGFPMMNILGPVIAAAMGGGDDPDDEYTFRKAIGDESLADMLLRGAPAALGVNMSQRLGMQNMTSLFPFAEKDPLTKEGFQERVLALAGPWAGLGAKVVDGAHVAMSGDLYKGAEMMLPSGIGNAMKGYRFATEGVSLRNNDRVLSPGEIDFLEATMQALGLPTKQLTDRQRVQGDVIKSEEHLKGMVTDLKHRYAKASREGDREEIAELRDEWKELQDTQRRLGFKPSPLSSLIKAPVEQRKRERNVIAGVEYKTTNKKFVSADSEI